MRFKETQDPKPTKRYKLQHKGVNIDGVHPNIIRYVNNTPDKFDILITSGNDGEHIDGSRHYKGNALDIALRNPMSKSRIANLKQTGVTDEQLKAVGYDDFAWHITQDDSRYPLGLTIIDVNHGSAPHIDLSWGNGTQNKKDLRLDPHSKEGRELARTYAENQTNSYVPDRLTVKPLPVTQTTEFMSDTQQSIVNAPIKTPQIPPSQKAEQQLTELMGMLASYETTKSVKVNDKARKSKANNTLLQKQKEADFKKKLQEQQFISQLFQASQIPVINAERVGNPQT